MSQRLFVYGTLKPGRRNAHLLEEIGGTWQAATVRGVLYPQGQGVTGGYPALMLKEHGQKISGFVFSSEKLKKHWQRLDAFEGTGYKRVVTVAELEDQRTVEANVYVLNTDNIS